MQHRRLASGRPSGTDGSDFSYRMVVDSRYTKVAKGKSLLRWLILAQAISQLIGALSTVLLAKEKGLNNFSILSIAVGFISLLIGELGRQRSLMILLRLYTTASSMATAFSVAFVVRSDFFSEVILKKNASSMNLYEIAEVVRVAFSILLQIVVIITTVRLVQNMSPKRA